MKIKPWFGIFGLAGFFGFAGVLDPAFYMFFAFFGFFAFYWDAKMVNEMEDERYKNNLMKAKAKTLDIVSVMFVAFIIGLNSGIEKDGFIIIIGISFAVLIITKSYLVYYYDKKVG